MGNNLYWNVYKSLERELLSLAEIIHIDAVSYTHLTLPTT